MEKKEKTNISKKVYSDQELFSFDQVLENFRITKTLSTGEIISYVKYEDYLLKERFTVEQKGYRPAIVCNGPGDTRYSDEMDKIRQWIAWKSKKQYGKKMADLELDKLASEKEIKVEDINF